MDIGKQVIEMALEKGATVAGIASRNALQTSASHLIYNQIGEYAGVGTVNDGNVLPKHDFFNWPKSVRSVLVIGLTHPENQPELDWWDGKGTPGNRRLIQILKATGQLIESRLNVNTRNLPYYIEKGGIFLKDAAVLAGIGTIGSNNMLITPAYGPRIRLRALFFDADVELARCEPFFPCTGCKQPCRSICPEKAMDKRIPIWDTLNVSVDLPARDGSYNRKLCNIRMEKDEAASTAKGLVEPAPVQYCRRCEFACPVGKKSDPANVR
jgi:epoxyqueuosine reductase